MQTIIIPTRPKRVICAPKNSRPKSMCHSKKRKEKISILSIVKTIMLSNLAHQHQLQLCFDSTFYQQYYQKHGCNNWPSLIINIRAAPDGIIKQDNGNQMGNKIGFWKDETGGEIGTWNLRRRKKKRISSFVMNFVFES